VATLGLIGKPEMMDIKGNVSDFIDCLPAAPAPFEV